LTDRSISYQRPGKALLHCWRLSAKFSASFRGSYFHDLSSVGKGTWLEGTGSDLCPAAGMGVAKSGTRLEEFQRSMFWVMSTMMTTANNALHRKAVMVSADEKPVGKFRIVLVSP
jgi:hypothetical protein